VVVTGSDTTQRYFSSKESSPNFPPQLQLTWNQPTAAALSAMRGVSAAARAPLFCRAVGFIRG